MTEQTSTIVEQRLPRRRGTAVMVAVLLLLLAGAAGGGAALALDRRPVTYQASAVLLIDQEPGLTASVSDGIINKLIRLRVKYVDLVQTTTFAESVGTAVGLDPLRVQSELHAAAPAASLLLRVSARDRSPQVAQRLAQSAAEILRDQLEENQIALGLKPGARVTLTVVSPARPGVRTSPARSRALLVGVVVGFGVLAGGIALVDVVRRRRRG